jgi:Uma2 family endonuclease
MQEGNVSTVEPALLTADELWAWASRPENQDKRYELERGRVVEVPPPGERHGFLCLWIGHLLLSYVLRRKAGGVCSNDTGLLVEEGPDTVRGPDLMLFAESVPFEKLGLKFVTRLPQLVVEVLSPTDQLTRVNRRVKQYLARGVPLVWLVDPEVRSVTVYQRGQEHRVLDETEELTGDGVLADFSLRVADLFAVPG